MELYFVSLFILVFGGVISVFLKDAVKLKFCALITFISSILICIPAIKSLITGKIFSKEIYISNIFGSVNFTIDPLSSFFIIVISVMSFLGILYAIGYIKPYLNKNMNIPSHCFFLMMLITSMLGVVTIQNSLLFLVMWEIMSVSSFFLVIFEGNKKEVLNAGIKYMVYMHISVIFIILAFVLANIYSESFNFNDFTNVLSQNPMLADLVFLFALIGFGTKAGFVPFHNWLPDAHPAAPSHISGIMSGIMIKTGIYGILRTIFFIGTPSKFMAYTLLSIAIISALWGVLYAISQHDVKKLLAYHSLENIGIIGIGIGIGMLGIVYNNTSLAVLGFLGGILHILNHSIFKMLLFFAAGNVYIKSHTRNIEMLGGLIKKMPFTALLFIIGSVAICALPPLNGFISEFLIYAAMIAGIQLSVNLTVFMSLIIALASLALIGTMAILCFTKVVGIVFLGTPRSDLAENVENDADKIMLIPMSILAAFTVIIGILPKHAVAAIFSIVFMIFKTENIMQITSHIINLMNIVSVLFIALLLIIMAIVLFRKFINKKSRIYSTWGCGYNKPSSRIQYTASSYADLFISTLKPMFKRIPHIKKPKDFFPKEAYYEVEIEDIEESYIVQPIVKLDEKILAKFERIQNGNMQQYILYGLIFLVLATIGLIYWG